MQERPLGFRIVKTGWGMNLAYFVVAEWGKRGNISRERENGWVIQGAIFMYVLVWVERKDRVCTYIDGTDGGM